MGDVGRAGGTRGAVRRRRNGKVLDRLCRVWGGCPDNVVAKRRKDVGLGVVLGRGVVYELCYLLALSIYYTLLDCVHKM